MCFRTRILACWLLVACLAGCQKSKPGPSAATDASVEIAMVTGPEVTVALKIMKPSSWYVDCGCACCGGSRMRPGALPVCVDSNDILDAIAEDDKRDATFENVRERELDRARRCGNIGCQFYGSVYVKCGPVVPNEVELRQWAETVRGEYEKNHRWLPEHGGPPGRWPPHSDSKHKTSAAR